jgi:hypothetical protein
MWSLHGAVISPAVVGGRGDDVVGGELYPAGPLTVVTDWRQVSQGEKVFINLKYDTLREVG